MSDMDAVRKVVERLIASVTVGVQYAIQLPTGTILMDGDPLSRDDQERRLERYRDIWPTAELVQRNVYYGAWKENGGSEDRVG